MEGESLNLSAFPIKGNPVFNNSPKRLPKNPLDCSIFLLFLLDCNWVFDNFILAEELFAKTLQSLETGVLVKKTYVENYFCH